MRQRSGKYANLEGTAELMGSSLPTSGDSEGLRTLHRTYAQCWAQAGHKASTNILILETVQSLVKSDPRGSQKVILKDTLRSKVSSNTDWLPSPSLGFSESASCYTDKDLTPALPLSWTPQIPV